MNDSDLGSPRTKWLTLATILLGTILSTSRTARAALTLGPSSGTSLYAVANTISPGPPTALFNPANGELLAPGGGLPQLAALTNPVQFTSQSPITSPTIP